MDDNLRSRIKFGARLRRDFSIEYCYQLEEIFIVSIQNSYKLFNISYVISRIQIFRFEILTIIFIKLDDV